MTAATATPAPAAKPPALVEAAAPPAAATAGCGMTILSLIGPLAAAVAAALAVGVDGDWRKGENGVVQQSMGGGEAREGAWAGC